MRPTFQSKQSVIINAPIEKVWEYNQDLSKIADYHPRVNKVDLISGSQFRPLKKMDDKTTLVEISHFYSSSTLKVWLLNFIIKPKIARETTDTLIAMKNKIENEY